MLSANEVRDKYNSRQRGTDLEEICRLMDKNGVTLEQLRNYIDNRPPSDLSRVRAIRKRLDHQRKFTYGRNNVTRKLGKSTEKT